MEIIIAALCGIGLGMLWDRAEPLIPLHDFVIIKLNRLYDWLSTKKLPKFLIWLPKYFLWWMKGAISCEPCSSPWLALGSGLILGLGWKSLIAMPVAFAIYTLLMPKKEFRESSKDQD